MPQMAPSWWLLILMTTTLLSTVMNTIMYHNVNKMKLTKSKKKCKKNKWLW